MPKRSKPQVEETQWGPQYVLPGAERIAVAAKTQPHRPREGDQFVFPGTEPITTGELLGRKMARLKPRRGQKSGRGAALFETDRE
ncbi:MAG: hypothetical protein ACYCZX_01280 [Rhodospirillaceae bacterium]